MKIKDFKGLDLQNKGLLAFESDISIDEIFERHDRMLEGLEVDDIEVGPAMVVPAKMFDGFVKDYGDVKVLEFRRDSDGYWWMRVEACALSRMMPKTNVGAFA